MTGAALPTDQPAFEAAPLQAAHLLAALTPPHGSFGRVDVVDSAGSTNTELAAGAADANQHWPDLSVLIANAQPAGKGRLGRSWEAPAGSAMISSVLVRPTAPAFAPAGYGWLSILAGVALCESLRSRTGVPVELKWPNDVVVRGRKVAGILAQVVPAAVAGPRALLGPGVVVGVGVNVSQRVDELPTERATSLLLELAPAGDGEAASGADSHADNLDRNVLLPAYLLRFAELYQDFVAVGGEARRPLGRGPSLFELAKNLMSTLGQEVRAELPGGVMLHGTATTLREDGALLVRDKTGTVQAVSAGDVIHLRRTGPDDTVHYA